MSRYNVCICLNIELILLGAKNLFVHGVIEGALINNKKRPEGFFEGSTFLIPNVIANFFLPFFNLTFIFFVLNVTDHKFAKLCVQK